MKTKLTKEAIDGLEWAVADVKKHMARGSTATKALMRVGVTTMNDTFFFMAYLEENHPKLLKKIK